RLVADEFDELPRLAAVGRLAESARGARGPGLAERRDVDDVRVGRVHHDAADGAGLLEARELPGEPAVARLEDAAARGDRVAGVFLPGARPHLQRVARRD